MKIYISAKTNARENKIEEVGVNRFIVWTTELPINGRANLSIIKIVADHMKIAKSQISICSGFKSKEKVIEVEE